MSRLNSYIHTPQNQSYLYTTIPERLEFRARRTPEKTAFVILSPIEERRSITCKELYEKTLQFAKGLVKSGVNPGDVVGMSLQNGIEWLICTFGIQAAGAIPLYFNFKRFDGMDVVQVLKNIGNCTALVFSPGTNDSNWKILQDLAKFESEKGRVKCDKVPSLRLVICDKLPKESNHPFTVQDLIHQGQKNTDTKLPKCDPDDICGMFLTSGSTGVPKAVARTYISMLMMGFDNGIALDINENDIYYCDSLFTWAGGFPHTFLFNGSTRVTSSTLAFKNVADRTFFGIKCIENENCTVASFFPYCFNEMAENIPNGKQWPLKSVSSTGLPIPEISAQVGCKIAKKFVNLYGLTELGYISKKSIQDSYQYRSFMIGKPIPGNEIKIVDDRGVIVPLKTTGEIVVRHHIKFLGYVNNPEKTKAVLLPNGWYKTDDIGFMDENQDVTVLGRKSDVMIISGALIYPTTTEEKIKNHPDVEDVCVVPIDDEKFFQQQCACVVPKAGTKLDKESIITKFMENEVIHLSKSEYGVDIPKYFLFLESLPKTPVGKIFRKGVVELAKEKLNLNG